MARKTLFMQCFLHSGLFPTASKAVPAHVFYITIRPFARRPATPLQPTDNQHVSNMPSFTLQKMAFYTLKDGLLASNLPPFKLRMDNGEWIIMISFEVIC